MFSTNPAFALAQSTLLIAAIIAVAAPQPALANVTDGAARTVSIADLDLSRPAGVQALRIRVEGALSGVCHSGQYTTLAALRQERTCLAEARERVRPQVERVLAVAQARRDAQQASAVLSATGG